MKKITSIFIIILTIIFMCGCDAETSNNAKKFSAKEGNAPGTIIIGDYTLSIVGTPHYETTGINQFGHYAHSLCVTLQIKNNGTETISFDELTDMGLAIYGYDADTCVGKLVRQDFSAAGVAPGKTEQFTISNSDPSYGSSKTPPDHIWGTTKTFDIEIKFNDEIISKKHYAN